MVEKMGSDQDDQNKQRGKASAHVGMALAAAIAAASPAHGQETIQQGTDYAGDTYTMDYGSSYEFSGSEDALKAIDALGKAFNRVVDDPRGTRVKSEVLDAMHKFIDAHPYREGKTTTTKDGAYSESSSYNPVFDLQAALYSKARRIDPLLAGVLLQELRGEQEKRSSMEGGGK